MSTKTNEILKQLTPSHITEQIPKDVSTLKEEVQNSIDIKPVEEKVTPKESLKSQREYTFNFNWTSPAGKNYKGEFTNRILTIRDKQGVGLMRAKLAGGMAYEAMDPVTIEINLIIAHLTFSLIKRPSWADDLLGLTELSLLQEIYVEVASHEAIFLGFIKDKEASEE